MASTFPGSTRADVEPWRAAGLRYYAYSFFLRQRFGHRVHKVSVDAKFTCPNVDGTVAVGGCVYCDNRSFSPSRRLPTRDIGRQIAEGIRRLEQRYDCRHFLAYFQPASNTYAPVERLRGLYEQALGHPQIVGLNVGTRPDCVADEVLDLLQDLARRTYVSVEYGMQTRHNRSLDWMNRGHDHGAMVDAVSRSRNRGFHMGAHLILGLPLESHDDMLASVDEVARLRLDSVKLHNLYAVQNTALAEQVNRGDVRLLERDEYVTLLVDVLERLPPSIVIERLGGDAPPEFLLGPSWCLDKAAFQRAFQDELLRRDTWQGKKFEAYP